MVDIVKKERSLLMCTSPLQILISLKLIKVFSTHSFDVVLVAPENNFKYEKYYNIISAECINSLFFVGGKNVTGIKLLYNYILGLKSNGILRNYDNYFIASIDSRLFQYTLSKRLPCSKIYTFDDGLANIINTSIYYHDYYPNFFRKIILKFMGVNIFSKEIKELSKLHFTIYKDVPNIVDSLYFISLMDEGDSCFKERRGGFKDGVLKIFLGQPLNDLIEYMDSRYVNRVLLKHGINYYYPHPKENYKIEMAKVIETDLVFEDYIMNFMRNNNCRVEVYTYSSSAALNVVNIKGVEVFFIYEDNIEIKTKFYSEMKKLFNLKIIG